MKVNIKKLVAEAVIPQYAKPGDAGMDLVAVSKDITENYVQYGTGLVVEIPEGYMGLIFPRSSNSKKDLLLCNSVGVIDAGYRGEVLIRFNRISNTDNTVIVPNWEFTTRRSTFDLQTEYKEYNVGDAVAQLIIMPFPQIEFEEVVEVSETERGEGGFGSTDGMEPECTESVNELTDNVEAVKITE